MTIEDWAKQRYAEGELSEDALEEIIAATFKHPLGPHKRRRVPWPDVVMTAFILLFPALWHAALALAMLSDPHDTVAGAMAGQMALLFLDAIPLLALGSIWD